MNTEKQIEEMAKSIDQAKYDMWVGKAHQSGDFTNHSKNIAKALYAEGYRKSSEVVEEIIDELEDVVKKKRLFVGNGMFTIRVVRVDEIEQILAELKKKYTEEGK